MEEDDEEGGALRSCLRVWTVRGSEAMKQKRTINGGRRE